MAKLRLFGLRLFTKYAGLLVQISLILEFKILQLPVSLILDLNFKIYFFAHWVKYEHASLGFKELEACYKSNLYREWLQVLGA
jgi:hypothetical protein